MYQLWVTGGGFIIGGVLYVFCGLFCLWMFRKIRVARKELQAAFENLPQPDEILMRLTERIDRVRALADGQKAKFIADGWNETIAEQMAASFLFAALSEQCSTHESHS